MDAPGVLRILYRKWKFIEIWTSKLKKERNWKMFEPRTLEGEESPVNEDSLEDDNPTKEGVTLKYFKLWFRHRSGKVKLEEIQALHPMEGKYFQNYREREGDLRLRLRGT